MSTIVPSTVERLRSLPLLQPLSDAVISALRPNVYECAYTAGETVLREGEYCDGAYYLLDGRVSVKFAPSGGAEGVAEVSGKRAHPRVVGEGRRAHGAPHRSADGPEAGRIGDARTG